MDRAAAEHRDIVDSLAGKPADEVLNDAGVTAADALHLFTRPSPPPSGWIFEGEVVYGEGGGRKLDLQLYRRVEPDEPRPAIVFVHGGGLRAGFPEMHAWHGHALAQAGYVSASIDYRVYPETTWPGSLEDVKCAIRWMRANAAEIGADPSRIALVGGSAGGYLSAMAALTPGRFEGNGGHPTYSSAVSAAVLFYPLTNMRWPHLAPDIQSILRDFMGEADPGAWVAASPIEHVHPGAPPILTITGDRDREVPVAMVRAFHERLEAVGARHELDVYPGRAHAFDYALADWELTFKRLRDFLDRELAASVVS